METLIYDRTQQDITDKTEKGRYNYTDFNRVESWCEYLANILNTYSYPVDIVVKTGYSLKSKPNESDLERIRINISTLKQAYFSFTKVPENLEYMTWQKANAIEKILQEIDYLLRSMENNFVYCGVAGCGQNRIWQQRFRRKYSYIAPISWLEFTYNYWNEVGEDITWEEVSYGNRNIEL